MTNKFNLTETEQRVLGCLLEKEITTPDQYPLSLNALTNACNQKSNRDPVVCLSEADVQDTLTALKAKRLIAMETGFGSRVEKYGHRFCNTEFGDFKLSHQELGIICILLLRGPQTPGELRTRTNRLCEFDNVTAVENVLSSLANRDDGALVFKLEREPGKRESRFTHLLGTTHEPEDTSCGEASEITDAIDQRASLEQRVEALEKQVAELQARLNLVQP